MKPDLGLLQNALWQQGPWASQALTVTSGWLIECLGAAVSDIDRRELGTGIQRFLPNEERTIPEAWSKEFFLSQLEVLDRSLHDG